MNTDSLSNLSLDTENSRYLVNSLLPAYGLDNFAQSNSFAFLNNDTHSTADALVDKSILSNCTYLNFIEFKAGMLKLNRDFQKIRRKATESLFIYAYWQNISFFSIPFDKQFLLVYNDDWSSDQNSRQRQRENRRVARRIIQQLQDNPVVNDLYGGNIYYCSKTAFDVNPMSYLK